MIDGVGVGIGIPGDVFVQWWLAGAEDEEHGVFVLFGAGCFYPQLFDGVDPFHGVRVCVKVRLYP